MEGVQKFTPPVLLDPYGNIKERLRNLRTIMKTGMKKKSGPLDVLVGMLQQNQMLHAIVLTFRTGTTIRCVFLNICNTNLVLYNLSLKILMKFFLFPETGLQSLKLATLLTQKDLQRTKQRARLAGVGPVFKMLKITVSQR